MNQAPSIARTAVLIPAWQPEFALSPLVDSLHEAGFGAIVVIDDGSPAESKPLLDRVATKPRVHLLRHAVNLGKGRALKTGINYFLNTFPDFVGLVTADADGQHAAEDIVRVANALVADPTRAVLGCRRFSSSIPFRSRIGNELTRAVFQLLSKRRVSDTQTGLRACPSALLPELLSLHGERYEYEMTVLAHLCRHGHVPDEIQIATIYIEENRSSHFKPMSDSMRIYLVLLRFYASSLSSAMLDFAGFSLTFALTRNLLTSLIVGRLSSLANFVLNRALLFRSGIRIEAAMSRYYLLIIPTAIVSYGLIRGLTGYLGWNVFVSKVIVDTLLSLAAFSLQCAFVFPVAQEE